MGIVAVVVVSVLILTSQTYAEVPVLILTFLACHAHQQGNGFFARGDFLCLQLRHWASSSLRCRWTMR